MARVNTAPVWGLLLAAVGWLLMAGVLPLGADGGTLRVANALVGAYRVNVFTDPTPITPDTIDVSVLVTFDRGGRLVDGLEVEVRAVPVEGGGRELRHRATRAQATDSRYYAANFSLGSVGNWDITVSIRGPDGEGAVSFQVRAQEPGPFQNPLLLTALALVPLLLVGWWLKASVPSQDASSPSSHPGD